MNKTNKTSAIDEASEMGKASEAGATHEAGAIDIETLHPLEVRVLEGVKADSFDVELCMTALVDNPGQAHQVVSWLHERGYAQIEERRVAVQYELTERGRASAQQGLLEERMLVALERRPRQTIPQLAAALEAEREQVGSAVGKLMRGGAVRFGEGKALVLAEGGAAAGAALAFVAVAKELLRRAKGGLLEREALSVEEREIIDTIAKKRGAKNALFKTSERTHNTYRWTERGRAARRAIAARGGAHSAEVVSALTPDMLRDGTWKGKVFRKLNINIPPSRVLLGRTSTYSQFLRDVKDTLVALGFSEFDGPLVESEFWNCDALFMPQFHSARDTHDVYYVRSPTHAKEIERRYLESVAQIHRDGGRSGSSGWKYNFDTDFTRRLILRSQGTALSAKQLRHATVPGKYFGIVRCFRYDQIDSTHLADFYQTEGIVLGEDVNLRTLLGLLRTFAVELGGATEVRFAPGYFPFTEPSIEVFVKHSQLGWFELGGAGIFRPEVTAPFGIDVPVLAWGLGVDRMALLKLKLNDLRQLFTQDIERIRLQTE